MRVTLFNTERSIEIRADKLELALAGLEFILNIFMFHGKYIMGRCLKLVFRPGWGAELLMLGYICRSIEIQMEGHGYGWSV